MTENRISTLQIRIFGTILLAVVLSLGWWGISEPLGVLDQPIPGNNDLLYFATDAPDNFIIYSPGRHGNVRIMAASQRMADMVISPDGTKVWTATKAGFIDRYEIPVDQSIFNASVQRQYIAPVLSSIALSASGRFIAVGYGNSENYNSRNIKILPSDNLNPRDEMADFSVSGDIQDIVANPKEDLFYIINSHSDRVRIYNAARFRLESKIIELGNSPGNFIVRPDGLAAYGAMNARNAVAVVDLTTNETLDYVPLGFPPHAMAFNESGSHLYIASRDSTNVIIFDTTTNQIVKRFTFPPRLPNLIEFNYAENIGVSSDENYIYVMPRRAELLVYDISMIQKPESAEQKAVMVQSEIMSTEPFFMEVIRGHTVPGVPPKLD
jgi:DNA-binding beta-propeller fold protein YncE